MKRMITAAAVLLLGISTTALAAEKGASQMSPGHEMQKSGSGATKGASEYSPGDRMQDKGTVGKSSKGASEYSPGDRMNDKKK